MRFHLVDDPWVPVRYRNGESRLLSLKSLFNDASGILDLDCTPPERVSLMRLLVCIVQSVFNPPEDSEEWEGYASEWEAAILPYLSRPGIHQHFELFGEGERFLQVRIGQDRDPVPMSKLFFHLASGNNATLFDQAGNDSAEREFKPEDIALGLLTFQNFYPLYGAGYRGKGPCVDGNMVHAFLTGSSLKETIKLACLDLESIQIGFPAGLGRPLWELDRDDPAYEEMATTSYLGRLAPRHRNLWLLESRTGFLLEKEGLNYPAFEAVREPTSTIVIRGGKDRRLLPARLDRALWRDLHEVAVVREAEVGDGRAPLVIQSHWMDCDESTELWLGALVTDLKAKIIDSIESSATVPKTLFTSLGRNRYQKGINTAEETRVRLWNAVSTYYKELKSDSPPTDKAMAHYWTAVEQRLEVLLQAVRAAGTGEADVGLDEWKSIVQRAARDAYAFVCPTQTPRQLKAFASGFRVLARTRKSEQSKRNAA